MKKFIVTITSILMLSTTSIISTSAFSFFKKAKEPTINDIKAIYNDIFYNYKYDEDLGKQAQERCYNWNLKNMFECDVNFIKENKGGMCRQFANLFIDKLTKIGVKAYALTMGDSKGLNIPHTTVIYEFDGKKYVTDIVESQYVFEKHGECDTFYFHLPLEVYHYAFKGTYDKFWILDIDKNNFENLEI